MIAQNRYDSLIPRREGPPLLSIVVSRIVGSIQRSHVYIPYILSLIKSTVRYFSSLISASLGLCLLLNSPTNSVQLLWSILYNDRPFESEVMRNSFEIGPEGNFPQIYLWIHVKCSSTSFKQRLWQSKMVLK